jgi:hypothetical protein
MVVALAVAVFLGALAALALPLARRASLVDDGTGEPGPLVSNDQAGAGLVDEREATLAALHELDFDYATGKLAEPEYEALRSGYERRALSLLKATDPAVAAGAGLPSASRNGVIAHPAAPGQRNGTLHSAEMAPAGGAPSRRGHRAMLLAGGVGLVFVAGVAAIYLIGNRSQNEQRPVATLEGIGPRALALAPAHQRRRWRVLAARPDAGPSPARGRGEPGWTGARLRGWARHAGRK